MKNTDPKKKMQATFRRTINQSRKHEKRDRKTKFFVIIALTLLFVLNVFVKGF